MDEKLLTDRFSESNKIKKSRKTKKKTTFNTTYQVNINKDNNHLVETPHYSNRIESSKYTWFNIVPKILLEQFKNVGNIYFLVLAILQLIPQITNSGGTPVNFLPLTIVVAINGIKDAVEDYKRKKADYVENNTSTDCLISIKDENDPLNTIKTDEEGFYKTKWESIKPGNVLKIYKNQIFPCDLCLLYSPNPKGVAYVETKSLDGETNLKMKESIKQVNSAIGSIVESNSLVASKSHSSNRLTIKQFLQTFIGEISADTPNDNMYQFSGNVIINYQKENINATNKQSINNKSIEEEELTVRDQRLASFDDSVFLKNRNNFLTSMKEVALLDFNNLLLRGSILMQTEYVYAVALYTGHSSKIMMNSINAQTKSSKLSKQLNGFLAKVLIIQCIICFFAAIINMFEKEGVFIPNNTNNYVTKGIVTFFCWFLNIQNIIPISLIVTLEMIKFCQSLYISWDVKIYFRPTKQPTVVQSSSLNEELGQIHHIFTDKTGTLTKNYMQYHSMLVKDISYGQSVSEKESIEEDQIPKIKTPHVIFEDKQFYSNWNNLDNHSKDIDNMVLSLAICHSAISEKITKENGETDYIYNSSSPDELALVNASKHFGVVFTERKEDNSIEIMNKGNNQIYYLKNIFEFNSDRKRMSIVYEDNEERIFIITKGADTVIIPRLNRSNISLQEDSCIDNIQNHLTRFGNAGLRTLLFSKREITKKEYASFLDAYNSAIAIADSDRQKKIDESYDILESNLTYLGASAIEDALQDDLKQTLINLREAGIKFWMLTGDNPLTAVSIAHSSGLIDNEYEPMIFKDLDIKDISNRLISIIERKNGKVCIVVTGQILSYILNSSKQGLKKVFTLAILKADCFIGCRVSPKQKAEIVLLVKNEVPENSTLAIGDGANDVNMISSAHVGIGIQGVEGTQASRASDYAIGQFSFLQRLMFIHGREAYRKNSFAVGYMLWKNFLYILPNVYYGFSTQFSGVNLYDPFIDILFNMLFTAFPIGWYSVADKEFQYKFLERSPKMYTPGLFNKYFNKIVFFKWYLYALFIAGFFYWITTSVLINTISNNHKMVDLSALGATIYFNIVFYVNLKLTLTTHSHEGLSIGVQVFSILSYFVVLYITSMFVLFNTYGNWSVLLTSFAFILQTVIIMMLGLLMEYAFRSLNFFIYELFIRKSYIKVKTSEQNIIKYKDEDDLKSEIADKNELIKQTGEETAKSESSSSDESINEDDISISSKSKVDNILLLENKLKIGNNIISFEYSKSLDDLTEEQQDYLSKKQCK